MRLGMSVPSYVELDVDEALAAHPRPLLAHDRHLRRPPDQAYFTANARSGPAQTQGQDPPGCRRRTAAAHPSDQAPYTAGKKAFLEATLP
jgi:hypothetical protein